MEESFEQICDIDCDEKAKQLLLKGESVRGVREFQSQCKKHCKKQSYKS